MSKDTPPDTDAEPGAPHPRESFSYVGHDDAEAALAEALSGARMHHAWLLAGPKGVGKATLAYRFARVALGAKPKGPRPLEVDPEDPIARRIAAQAHPDLFILKRGLNDRGKPRREITVDDARGLAHFFALAPAEGGKRIAIIDAVDDLNRNAANAILKTLEEPPPNCVLLLICHAPGAALATIRSRCRRLALRPLNETDMKKAAPVDDALIALANGRPGRAIALDAQGLGENAAALKPLLASLTAGGAQRAAPALYDKFSGEAFDRFASFVELAGECVRAKAAENNSDAPAWAEAWSALETLRAETEGLDMDPKLALARAAAMLDRVGAAKR